MCQVSSPIKSTVSKNTFTLVSFLPILSGCSAFLLKRSVAEMPYSELSSLKGPLKQFQNY